MRCRLGCAAGFGGSALVVCPSSLVHNWLAEAERFVPELRTMAVTGPKRHERLAEAGAVDLMVTSYALLRLDHAAYRDRDIDVVVTDLQMRNVHGLELITILRDYQPRPGIIAISGTGEVQLDMAQALGR